MKLHQDDLFIGIVLGGILTLAWLLWTAHRPEILQPVPDEAFTVEYTDPIKIFPKEK